MKRRRKGTKLTNNKRILKRLFIFHFLLKFNLFLDYSLFFLPTLFRRNFRIITLPTTFGTKCTREEKRKEEEKKILEKFGFFILTFSSFFFSFFFVFFYLQLSPKWFQQYLTKNK